MYIFVVCEKKKARTCLTETQTSKSKPNKTGQGALLTGMWP